MVHLTARHVIVSCCLVLAAASVVAGGTLQTRILQYSQDRLYFASGTEAHIYPHSRFIIMCGNDSIYEGCINKSFLGVSYSYPALGFFDSLPLDSCCAKIESAEVDRSSIIRIGLSGIEPHLWQRMMIDTSNPGSSFPNPFSPGDSIRSGGSSASISSYPDYIDLVFKMQLGELDGFVSFVNHGQEMPGDIVIDAQAPFIVVMIPNLSRDVNRGGQLAVSLYYRFNEDRLPLLFRGDNATPIHSFCPSASAGVRPYPFSTRQGRELLEQHQNRPRQVHLGVWRESLEKPALFFADVLSRDRVEVKLVDRFEDADVCFALIEFDEQNDLLTLRRINDLLRSVPTEFIFQQEVLDSVGVCIATAAGETDSTQRTKFLLRADQYLMHDLGVLPLFRPRVYFHGSKLLTDFRFSAGGRFVLNDLTKLKLPSPGAGCSQ